MASILDKYNEHLFLEHSSNKSNSFIANVNLIASKFNELVRIDEKFDAEAVRLLVQLVQNSLDINVRQIAEDLRKGSYNGNKKLDIDLLTNFADYDYFMSDEDKNALWNDPAKQVYYSSIDVYFTDNTSISKEFSSVINNHRQLFSVIDTWDELKERFGDTLYNISSDTPIKNHELLRFVDNSVKGSLIDSIVLHVADNGQNQAYDAVFAGAKTYTPEFAWMDTTSALITIAHKINDVIHASDYIEQIGIDFVDTFNDYLKQVEQLAQAATESKFSAQQAAHLAEEILNKQLNLTVTSSVLSADANPIVMYNAEQHVLSFGLPRAEIAVVGLSNFAVNTANGHLTLETIRDEDVNRVYVNEDGNIIIEMK